MTASWLIQMGWSDTYVLADALNCGPLVEGPHHPQVFGLGEATPELVSPKDLAALMVGGGAIVVDLTDSRDHRKGHIPASRFAIRANLPGNLDAIPGAISGGSRSC